MPSPRLHRDGGLYVPEALPRLPDDLATDGVLPYPALAFDFLRLFDTDHSGDELLNLIDESYGSFTDLATAPLKKLADNLFVLELFHGPTLAFKDFGLQLVEIFSKIKSSAPDDRSMCSARPRVTPDRQPFMGWPVRKGSTFYPLPTRARVRTAGATDDLHRRVEHFPDPDRGHIRRCSAHREGAVRRSGVQSQDLTVGGEFDQSGAHSGAVDLLHSRLDAVAGRKPQPTFVCRADRKLWNILAGWLASRMGLPADRFVLATNQNDILYRMFSKGVYEPGPVRPSLAPSMDIQIASNFERFLFYQLDGDGARVAARMKSCGRARH